MWVRGTRSRDRSPPGERQLEPPPRFPSPGDLTGGGCDRSRGKFWKRIQPLCAPHALNAGRGCSCAPGGLSPFSFLQRPALRSCTDSTLPMPIACSHLPSKHLPQNEAVWCFVFVQRRLNLAQRQLWPLPSAPERWSTVSAMSRLVAASLFACAGHWTVWLCDFVMGALGRPHPFQPPGVHGDQRCHPAPLGGAGDPRSATGTVPG